MLTTPIGIIAGIFALLAVVKMLFIFFNKKAWYNNVAAPFYKSSSVTGTLFGVLAVIVFYYLIQALTLVEIFAVMAFTGLMMGIAFLKYSKVLLPSFNKIINSKLSFWMIVYCLVWLALSLLVLYIVWNG